MPKKNRETLKAYFQRGRVPSANQFSDLIDSALNIADDGIERTGPDGLRLRSLAEVSNLISFYDLKAHAGRTDNNDTQSYVLALDHDTLALRAHDTPNGAPPRAFVLGGEDDTDRLRIGINVEAPEDDLHVDGFIRAGGRIGLGAEDAVADGRWHDITGPLRGFHAFEVVAGLVDVPGRYSLVHAIAFNTEEGQRSLWRGPLLRFLNRKQRIWSEHSYAASRSAKLRLRWRGDDRATNSYHLEIRTNGDYRQQGDVPEIRCYLTQLWRDQRSPQLSRTR